MEKKDRTNGWFQQHKLVLLRLKDKAPEVYKFYIEDFGGEEKFKDMWNLLEIPKTETKEGE